MTDNESGLGLEIFKQAKPILFDLVYSDPSIQVIGFFKREVIGTNTIIFYQVSIHCHSYSVIVSKVVSGSHPTQPITFSWIGMGHWIRLDIF